jgi:hypothetical protein
VWPFRVPDLRLSNIVTLAAFRKKGYGMTVVCMLIGAAGARESSTFTFEDVAPNRIEATSIYRRFGAVFLSPRKIPVAMQSVIANFEGLTAR